MSASEIFREEGKSVVEIETDEGQGSGVVISKDGMIVTNFHVIDGAHSAIVRTLQGKVLPVRGVLELDKAHDLALIKVTPVSAFKPIPIGNSSRVKIGERVIALGNPEGFQNTISEGIVSGFRMSFSNIYWGFKLFQITTPISPGSSGGALLNSKGELVGITSAGFVQEAENLNIAVPIDYVKPMLPETGRFVFVEKFAPTEASPSKEIRKETLETSLYFMDNLFKSVSDIIDAEAKTEQSGIPKPDIRFYETQSKLEELAAMMNLNHLSNADAFEEDTTLKLADALMKLSECARDFIEGANDPENGFSDRERARGALKDANLLLLQASAKMLSAEIGPDVKRSIVNSIKNHPPYFAGEPFLGLAALPEDKDRYRVICVYPGSPAQKAGIKENDILTSMPDESMAGVYKNQLVAVEQNGKPVTVQITPVLFGFASRPAVIGLEKFENGSVSPQAAEQIETRLLAALNRSSNVLAVPVLSNKLSVREEAEQYGLDYVMQGKILRCEFDSAYSVFPSQFEGYDAKLDVSVSLLDPFGQPTSCCKTDEADIHSSSQSDTAAFESAASALVDQVISEMKTAGIIRAQS